MGDVIEILFRDFQRFQLNLYTFRCLTPDEGSQTCIENGYFRSFISSRMLFYSYRQRRCKSPVHLKDHKSSCQEFKAWCGMPTNVKKTYLFVIDHDKKRREQELAPLLTINRESLQKMNLDEACRYLGY